MQHNNEQASGIVFEYFFPRGAIIWLLDSYAQADIFGKLYNA